MKQRVFAVALAWIVLAPLAQAQWLTQTNRLKAGWNAVYLHVDLSHTNIGGLLRPSDPVEEIWMWNPELPPGQSVATPPSPSGSQWSTWVRDFPEDSPLQILPARAALLVKVSSATASFEWNVKGRPVEPFYRWTLSGLNFIGLASAEPAPSFESFLAADAQSLDWAQNAEIFRYQGGALGATNPVLVSPLLFRNIPVRRDQAYWIRTGEPANQVYNQYFGPFQVSGAGAAGIRFGEGSGQARLRLRNMTPGSLTVTLRQVVSESAPVGETPVAGWLPLLLRGAVNLTNLTFGYTSLAPGTAQWTLAPKGEEGAEVEIILGVNHSQMGSTPGTSYAGVLRFTDSLGLSRVDIGASATAPSQSGLWVGKASVDYVSTYLKSYARATNEADFQGLLARLGLSEGGNGYHYEWDSSSGRVLVFGGPQDRTGSYLLDGPIKLDEGGVARPFPLRLIVHHDGVTARLLQRAYLGTGMSSNLVVATRQEALLPSHLASARRVSAIHLPTSDANIPWTFSGTMEEGSALTTTVSLDHRDQASNPFVHTYHPDHDNLDAFFSEELPPGRESYGVRRLIALQFNAPDDDFDSLTRAGAFLSGDYAETVTFLDGTAEPKQFHVLGRFHLARLNDIATLTTP